MDKGQQADGEQLRHACILIVDDDPLLGDLLREALQEEAYQACHVLSGEMALAALQTAVPALLLLDYHLPGMNGLELADVLGNREAYRHIPILLMSADVPQEVSDKRRLRTLQKPFDLETLFYIIAELLT